MAQLYEGIYTICNPEDLKNGDFGSFRWSCSLCGKYYFCALIKARDCCKTKITKELNLPSNIIDVIWNYTSFAEAWYKEVHDIYG